MENILHKYIAKISLFKIMIKLLVPYEILKLFSYKNFSGQQ